MRFFIISILASCAFAAPTVQNNQAKTLSEVLNKAGNDTLKALYSKAAILQFVGQTAANAAVEGGRSSAEYVTGINFEANLNQTEERIKAQKVAMIENTFGLKRNLLRSLFNLRKQMYMSMNAVINGTITNLNNTINALQNGMTVSKEAFANLWGSGNATTQNPGNSGNPGNPENPGNPGSPQADGANSTAGFLTGLVNAKEALFNATENFSSQALFHQSGSYFSMGLNASFNGAGGVGNSTGVFQAMDNIFKTLAKIPKIINGAIISAKNSISGNVQNGTKTVENEDVVVLEEEEPLFEKEGREIILENLETQKDLKKNQENLEIQENLENQENLEIQDDLGIEIIDQDDIETQEEMKEIENEFNIEAHENDEIAFMNEEIMDEIDLELEKEAENEEILDILENVENEEIEENLEKEEIAQEMEEIAEEMEQIAQEMEETKTAQDLEQVSLESNVEIHEDSGIEVIEELEDIKKLANQGIAGIESILKRYE